jgi:hypothetical protein
VHKDDNPRKGRAGHSDKEERPEYRRHHREERHEPSGEQKVFADLVQRRLGGGATPTAQAYTKAMQQWQQLPGAVQFVVVPKFPQCGPGSPNNPGEPADKPPARSQKTGKSV